MEGSMCMIWKLKGMFHPKVHVSNHKGKNYKKLMDENA
jgi:hypothetical protein